MIPTSSAVLMMTRTMELGRTNLALKYGEAKKQPYQSKRTGDQTSIDTDVDVIRLQHEGTRILPAGVNRKSLKLEFAGITLGDPDEVSAALVKAVAGDRSKLKTRMILQGAAGGRSLCCHLARGQSKEQTRRALEEADILFRGTYEKLLQQPAGTFHPPTGQPGRHKEQAEFPRHLGGYNLPTLGNLQEPAAAGAMVGIIDLLLVAQCSLLGAEESDPMQWYKCTSPRLLFKEAPRPR